MVTPRLSFQIKGINQSGGILSSSIYFPGCTSFGGWFHAHGDEPFTGVIGGGTLAPFVIVVGGG